MRPAPDEEDERECDFDDDEGRACFAAAANRLHAAEALLQRFVYVALGHAQRGQDAGEDAGGDGEGKGEEEHGAAEADLAHAGQLVGEEFEQQLNAEVSDDKAQRASA